MTFTMPPTRSLSLSAIMPSSSFGGGGEVGGSLWLGLWEPPLMWRRRGLDLWELWRPKVRKDGDRVGYAEVQ